MSPKLIERSFELGPPALQFLGRAAFDFKSGADPSAFLALCRYGAGSAQLAPRALEALEHPPNGPFRTRREAALVWLLRLGRVDLFDADPHRELASANPHYVALRSTVTPASSAEVCKVF